MHGEKHLPIPVAKRCVIKDRFKACGMPKLGSIHLSGGNAGCMKGTNTVTHSVFSNRISTIFRFKSAGGMLVHRNDCVSICYGLSSIHIFGKRGIGTHSVLNIVRSSNSNGYILRFRLHGRARGLGPRT